MKTSKEVFMSRVLNDRFGQMPVFLRDLTLGMDVTDVRTTDVFTTEYNSELSADAMVAFQRATHQDAMVGCVHSAAFVVEQFGGTMKYPEYGIPLVMEHPFTYVIDVLDLDPMPKGKVLGAMESYSLVRRKLPDVALVANFTGPLTKAGVLTGMERLSLATMEDPDFIVDVIRKGLENTYECLKILDSEGAMDCVFLAAATDNPDLFGSEVYKKFVIPYLNEMVNRIHRMGYPVIFHPHGVFTEGDVLERTLDTGVDGFQFAEDNDPSVICEMIGGRCSVLGGTDVVPTLLSGTEEDIRSQTRRYIDACSGSSYVFMCSCSLHRKTPIDNVMIMVDEARRYSQFTSGL